MNEVTPGTTTTEAARFVGVAVSTYDHDTFTPLPQTLPGVQRVSETLSAHAYQVDVLSEPRESEARAELRGLLAMDCLPTGGSLIVLWSGHGEPAAEGVLHLIGRDTKPGSAPEVDSSFIAGLATRTGASQVLLLFDTCYAGTGIMSAATVARRVLQELPPNAERLWVGVVASALELQPARDGVFLERLAALLQNGPTDPELRLRWSAHSRGVRGDDVIDALVKEWNVSTQLLDAQMSGNAWIMLPNPRYDPHAPEQVVEHLLLAARGGDPGDETSYFSGRVAPLAHLADWVKTARPGIFVVTGPAGSGKSALVGRLVSLSNPTERARLLAPGPVEHADPGEQSVHAHVHVRGSTVERLVQELDDQLVRAEVLSPRPGGSRNRGDLLGELERSPVKPVIVIDGLDEAASEAWQLTTQVLSLLAGNACIIVATRDLAPAEDGPSLVETLAPQELINLGDTANRQDATEAVRAYVAKRLADSVAGGMDTAAVAEAIIHLARAEGEGLFLLARVITSQLRAEPLDTSQPGWEARLSRSVEAAFTRDIERIPLLRRDGTDLPAAVRELLTALAWSYGAGLPTDIWAVIATALSAKQVRYDRYDVYWLLGQAGRYIVEDGEGDHAVYRLSHQRLVEHLHPRPAPAEVDSAQQQAAPVATALIDHYLALLASTPSRWK